jgi:hypothetical protein
MRSSILLFITLLTTTSHAIDLEVCYNETPRTIETIQDRLLDLSEKGRLSSDDYERMMRQIDRAETCDEAVAIAIQYISR